MAKNSGPDPRFDPRFQRGYDGPEPDAPATPAASSPLDSAGGSRPAASTPAPSDGDTAHGVADVVAPAASSDEDGFWSPPRRNPFALALLLGSLAMIAVGLWLFWTVATASTFPNGYDRTAQALSILQQELTPALLMAGLLGVIAWVVLGAGRAPARGRR